MTTRTSTKTATFSRPFKLKGFEQPQPAGTYTVETEQELLDTVTSLAYRRTSTVMLLRAPGGNGKVTQAVTIDPAELDAALARDRREDTSGAETSRAGASSRAAASPGCDVEPQVGAMTKQELKAFDLSRILSRGLDRRQEADGRGPHRCRRAERIGRKSTFRHQRKGPLGQRLQRGARRPAQPAEDDHGKTLVAASRGMTFAEGLNPIDRAARRDLRSRVRPFETPIAAKSVFQLATSVGLFVAACAVMYWSLQVSALLTLFLAIPAGALLVRVFIIQHDCGHGSFFLSRRANDAVGMLCSVLTFTPYANWRRQHAGHHRSWNNLDRRQSGSDFYSVCLTVEEYRALSPWRRFLYRLPRHPLIAHIVIPPLVFLVLYRLPFDTPKSWTRERWSVYGTNIAIAALFASSRLGLSASGPFCSCRSRS